MAGMLAVRFAPSVIAAVRRFAKQDGVTVSQWIRKLVLAEMEKPDRQPPVDFTAYPQTQTVASGTLALTDVVITGSAPASVTGWCGRGLLAG